MKTVFLSWTFRIYTKIWHLEEFIQPVWWGVEYRWLADFSKPDHNVTVLYTYIISLENVIQCILILASLSWCHPDPSPPFCTPSFIVFPSLFLFSSSTPRPPVSLVYVGQLFLGMGPTLECGWYISYHFTEENRLFFSRSNQVPTAASARYVLRTPTSGIDFCLLCLHSQFVSLYICPVVSEKKNTVFLKSSFNSGSYKLSTPSAT